MDRASVVITQYLTPLHVFDKAGSRMNFESRYANCFIITLKGMIRFSSDLGTVFSDKEHSVFLPCGLRYLNECIEDAESYVFNFQTAESEKSPLMFEAPPSELVRDCFENIKRAALLSLPYGNMLAMRELYSLSLALFSNDTSVTRSERLVSMALDFMMKHYDEPSLTVSDIAGACFISEIYLRKLFEKELATTPYKKLTEIRMKKASLMIMEKRPITEIAEEVGYYDVFSFSRAYKRFYGNSPSKDKSKLNY